MLEDEDFYDEDSAIDEEYQEDDDGAASEDEESEEDTRMLNHSDGPLGGIVAELAPRRSYTVMGPEEMEEAERKLCVQASELLNCNETAIARVVLRAYGWDLAKLAEDCLENDKPYLKKAHIKSFKLEKRSRHRRLFSCEVCYGEVPYSETYALPCGHRFCVECWKEYLDTAVEGGAGVLGTSCMSRGCELVVHEAAFQRLASPEKFAQYRRFLVQSYVDDNPLAKWCPRPDCTYAVLCGMATGGRGPVTCKCGYSWCFRCADWLLGDHQPASCEQSQMWRKKESDESETVKWLSAHTKRCPKCMVPIEKNDGCMHMTCRNRGCNHEFCWLCRGPWTEHGTNTGGYYACNRYTGEDQDDKLAKEARTDLERYQFYYHRFVAYQDTMAITARQRTELPARRAEFEAWVGVPAKDLQFLEEALDQIAQDRRVLMWSYVVGYSLANDPAQRSEKVLFEFVQAHVEQHTDKLVELYEQDTSRISYNSFTSWRKNVIDTTRHCHRYLENFSAAAHNGFTR